MESKKGLKAPEKLCIIGSLPYFFLHFEIRILFADAILYFQVVLKARKMPPYELLLKIFLCDPPRPQHLGNFIAITAHKYVRLAADVLYINIFHDVSRKFDEFRVNTHLGKLRCWYL